jgi:hypothetical protein
VSIVAVAGNRLVPVVRTGTKALRLTTSHQLAHLPELAQWVSEARAFVVVVKSFLLPLVVGMQVAVYLALVLDGLWMVPVVLADDRLVERVSKFCSVPVLLGLGLCGLGLRVLGKKVRQSPTPAHSPVFAGRAADGLYPLNVERKLQVEEDGHQVLVRHRLLALEMLFLVRHWQSRTRLYWHNRCCGESRR